MKFLTKLGQISLNIGGIVAGIGPLGSMLFPQHKAAIDKFVGTSSSIVSIISQIEVVGQTLLLPGTDKLKAATPLVAQVILSSDALVGKKIKDNELFKSGCTKITDGWADVINSLEEK
jgi:hypothetical protein